MKYNTKILAAFLMALMLAVCLVPLAEDQADADTTPTFKALYPGSWTWDTTTGLGPFNSFYAAFDMNDGNKFVSVLDPYDLSKTISGSDLPSGSYNIMWVLPTVYWSVDANGDLTLSNDSTQGTAYAHTIDGHVYNYVAYGVHEAGTKTVDSKTVLTSEPNVSPVGNQTRATFRTYAHNYSMDPSLSTDSTNNPAYSMLWNFHQWELYKYCCLAVMEDFNAQNTVGNGPVFYSGSYAVTTTGATDAMGPYAGNPGLISDSTSGNNYGKNSVKLFVENAWGGSSEWVDGVMISGNAGYYIDTKSTPNDAISSGSYVTYVNQPLMSSSGYTTTISTNEQTWGMQTTNASGNPSATVGVTDYQYTSSSGNFVLLVGGGAYYNADISVQYGLSSATASNDTSFWYASVGSRLAFVFDAGAASPTPASYTYKLDYTAENMASGSNGVSVAGMDPISHSATYTATIESSNTSYGTVNQSQITGIKAGTTATISDSTMTINLSPSVTIAATPTANGAQYSYSFTGWFVDNVQVTGTYTISQNTTFEARFIQSVNSYTITWSIDGVTTTESYDYGELPTHADPTKEGYYFIGWEPEITIVTGNATYTAQFSESRPVTIAFDATTNGGQLSPGSISSKDVVSGNAIGSLPTADRTNYDFIGWFTQAQGGTQITESYIVTETQDFTVYAQYELMDSVKPIKTIVYLIPTMLFLLVIIGLANSFYRRN